MTVNMRIGLVVLLHRKIAAMLCGGPLLLACAHSPAAPGPGESLHENGVKAEKPMSEMKVLLGIAVARLTPDQAVEKRHMGKRIRWAGAVHHIKRSDGGVCLTILYARTGDHGGPRWTVDPTYQSFDACTAGSYDPELVQDFTNVTIVGRIAGKAYIGMGGGGSIGPVVEIEKLYRWSDCLAGDDSPVCRNGFLTPEIMAED